MAKKKTKFPLPTNDTQVNEYITTLAEAQIAVDRAVTKANDKVAAIKASLAEEVAEHEAIIKQYAAALFAYFEANQAALTDDGKRESCTFATGVLGQRRTPPRTQITDEDSVVEYVREHLLTEFYEEKTVLRRDAMLANKPLAETVPGVAFVQDRIVYVKPDRFDVTIDLKKKVVPAD